MSEKNMIIYRTAAIQYSSVIAIGNFDGVHLGHQKILQRAVEIAKDIKAVPLVLTFEPYPQQYFHPESSAARLSNLREKINSIINAVNINHIYILKFNKYLSLYSPEEFIQSILRQKLNASYIIAGEDFRFGRERQGDVNFLKKFIPVEIMTGIFYQAKRISSTWMREVLKNADFKKVKNLLGREYSMIGRVIKGQQRGRQLGFPTANIALKSRVPPFTGVYAVKIKNQYNHFLGNGIANLGTRPTVHHDNKIFLEVHLLDFNQDIYGQLLEIIFVAKIRDERRFESLQALQQQIRQDVITAKINLNKIIKSDINI